MARHKADAGIAGTVRPRRARHTIIAGAASAALLLSVVVPIAASAASAKSTVTLSSSEASWTTIRHPSTPQHNQPYLSATNTADKTYLKFDSAKGLKGRTVVSATLRLSVRSTAATSGTVTVYPSSSSWTAKTLTDRNRPPHVAKSVNAGVARAVAGKTISVPISPSAISKTGTTSLELRYSQKYVGTTFRLAPTLSLVLSSSAPASVPKTTSPAKPATPRPSASPSAPTTNTPSPTAPAAPSGPAAPTTAPKSAKGLSYAVPAPNSSAKKVFAHYFPPYPISLDNKDPLVDYYARNYLTPAGENGIHAAYGGLLRDRPQPRSPLGGDWKATDLTTEVNQAADAGIDGFTVDIMSLSGQNWDQTVGLMNAAAKSGRNFTVTPNIDVTASAGSASPATIAAKLAQLYSYSSAYRLSDGRYVLSSFKAEGKTAAWWSQVMSELKNTYNIRTAFIAVFLNASDANMKAFAPISYALSNWGERTPSTVNAAPDYVAKAKSLGVKWMQPVAVQDTRPRNSLYAESGNTETLRASWARAISDGADLVQLTTWNDYSETTSFAPSAEHGSSFLDIDAYYLAQFKNGTVPRITSDSMYVTHRKQLYSAAASTGSAMKPTLDGTSTAPRNTVELLTFLTAPATVSAVIGGKTYTANAPAGVSAVTFPLSVGSVSAAATRNGATILAVKSPYAVVARPATSDMEYVAANSHGG